MAQADTQAASGQRGDWLYGGAGDDNLFGDLTGIDTILVDDDRGVFLNLAKTHSEVVYGDDVFAVLESINEHIINTLPDTVANDAVWKVAA